MPLSRRLRVALLAACVLVPVLVSSGSASAATIGLNGRTFNDACNAANAGDVITVPSGAYGSQTISCQKAVTFQGQSTPTVAYVAFSGAVEQGLWTLVSPLEWLVLLLAVVMLLCAAFAGAWATASAVGLDRPDRIAFLFAGAHKSVAMGAPLAAVLFPPQVAGLALLPLLIYHLLQLVASAPLANRLVRP